MKLLPSNSWKRQRFGDAPACPRCGAVEVYKMTSVDGSRNADYRWRCRGCKKVFTVRTGTIFEESRLPLRVWVFAFWRACASKKGVSALQLSREFQITHKSALFVLRRIRHAMGAGANAPKLTGTIEADEVYIGGRRRGTRRGRPGADSHKTPVFGVVQRDGDVRTRMMERLTSERLAEVLAENADRTCRLITDDYMAYRRVGQAFGSHEVMKHTAVEYVRTGTDIHSNTIEGVWSLIRRGVMGTFHSVSRKHLPNYLNEFEFSVEHAEAGRRPAHRQGNPHDGWQAVDVSGVGRQPAVSAEVERTDGCTAQRRRGESLMAVPPFNKYLVPIPNFYFFKDGLT